MIYKDYNERYAKLLVNKCLQNHNKPLVIIIEDDELLPFAEVCLKNAKEVGFNEINIFNKKNKMVREYLIKTNILDIKKNVLLDWSIVEENAINEGSFLFLESFQENIWNNVDDDKLNRYRIIVDEQLDFYLKNISDLICQYCIACYPTLEWAKKVYPNLSNNKAYDLLFLNIMKVCLCDKNDPEKEWNYLSKRYNEIAERLTDLKIKYLHYSNKIGTNLNVFLPDNHLWLGTSEVDFFGNNFISNMPSYELFTSPLYKETEGVVYSSIPIYYDLVGKLISPFRLEFKHGVVQKILTKNNDDYKIIRSIIEYDENSKYLGECAIVENNNLVANTNTLYYNPLYDENTLSHLALGDAFPQCIENGVQMSYKELDNCGINLSGIHVDFMIGTGDLKIEADTKNGKKLIFSNGRIVI